MDCRGFQYEVGKTYEEDVTPVCCDRGFHFCKELNDCFNYYKFNPDNKVAKVVALGEIDEESDSSKAYQTRILYTYRRDISLRDEEHIISILDIEYKNEISKKNFVSHRISQKISEYSKDVTGIKVLSASNLIFSGTFDYIWENAKKNEGVDFVKDVINGNNENRSIYTKYLTEYKGTSKVKSFN